MTATKNVTLSLPEPLLMRFRVYAAKRNQSMTALAAEAIRNLLDREEDETESAKLRFIERMRNPPGRGIGGTITWTRDELHER